MIGYLSRTTRTPTAANGRFFNIHILCKDGKPLLERYPGNHTRVPNYHRDLFGWHLGILEIRPHERA